jgi:hypothetical protein
MWLHHNLEATSGNFLSLLGRVFEPLMRNGAFCYTVLIFSALNWVHALFLSHDRREHRLARPSDVQSIFSPAVEWIAGVTGHRDEIAKLHQ